MIFFENKWPALLLWPLSLVYGAVIFIRNLFYDLGILLSCKINCPVICVGNIVVGGTGKTPTVITLAQWFAGKQYRVCIISRGYGRKSTGNIVVSDGQSIHANVYEAGDEALLMANALPGIPVIVNKDRVQAARYALKTFAPDLLILDDGLQHRRIRRDLDIVTINSSKLFGNGFVLPAGPLREPLFHLKRADIIWINSNDENDRPPNLQQIKGKPVIHAMYSPVALGNAAGRTEPAVLQGVPVLAFSGLGNPDSFKKTLTSLGADIKMFITFQDHHFYTEKDIQMLENIYNPASFAWFVTTEKDWVKLPQEIINREHWKYLAMQIKPRCPDDLQQILLKIKSVS